MLNVRLAGGHLYGKQLFTWAVAGGNFDGVFLCCPFFPVDVLDEIWDVTESVSDGFLTYSSYIMFYLNCTNIHISLDLLLIQAHSRLPNYLNC